MQPAQSSPSTRQVRAWHFCLLATECSLYSQTSLIAAASPYLPSQWQLQRRCRGKHNSLREDWLCRSELQECVGSAQALPQCEDLRQGT